MKKMSKKLLISVLALVFAFVAVGSTTYAWFTLTNKAEVKKFDAKVRAAEGLEIKVNEQTDWYSGIADYDVPNTVKLDAITMPATAFDLENPGFKKLARDYDNITYVDAAATDYVKLNIMFKASVAGDVYLRSDSYIGTVTPETDNVVAQTFAAPVAYNDGTADIAKGAKVTYNAGDAIRMAMFANGSNTDAKYFENIADTTLANTKGIVDPSAENWTKALALFKAKMTTIAFDNMVDDLTQPTLYDEETVEFGKTNALDGHNNLTAKLLTLKKYEVGGFEPTYKDTTDDLENSYYGMVTVFIWVEGWDAECYDALFNDVIKTYLAFEFVPAA